jgi:4-amino-4-deoxy-L-arabinose transferase-like glycosyltransferase
VREGEGSPASAQLRWIWLAPLFAAAVWFVVHQDLPWELWGGDEAEYVDVARRVARGDGFTTGIIYPVELEYGVGRDHPSLVRPPLWPALVAAAFAIAGPEEWAIHLVLLVVFAACATVAFVLGAELAGLPGAVLATFAVVTSPDTLVLAFLGGTETLYAFWVLLAFLLLARGSHAVWVGAACGFLYLTRYNGIVLLPVALGVLAFGGRAKRDVLWCVAGFAIVALPWWIRNLLVTGNPVFTYYRWGVYFSPFERSYTTSLLHMIEPSIDAPTAMDPFEKARLLLPQLFLQWPLAAANLSACVGLLVACVRRNRLAIAFAVLAIATTVGLSFALPRGRYFAPLFPTLVTLGIGSWLALRSHWKWLAVAVLIAAPVLPEFPTPGPDLRFIRRLILRTDKLEFPEESWSGCLKAAEPAVVVAEDASMVGWKTDLTTIWLPATRDDFWRIVGEHDPEFVYIVTRRDLLDAEFAESFESRGECGPNLYQRRALLPGGSPEAQQLE